ncbi:MAG: hypothetical protein M1833_001079 [Piccolia ochrophora]|nr:MAG: hypothetical protein M1833_001079 [Piccolia ochrophora]
MAPHLFGNGPSVAKLFEIRLVDDVVLLRGLEQEPPASKLQGTVVLCLSEPLAFKSINLRLLGTSRVAPPHWAVTPTAPQRGLREEAVFLRKHWKLWTLEQNNGDILQAGNYEFPFEHEFSGNTKESVEGLLGSWVSYRLKATIERGLMLPNVLARKHVRVVRTLAESDTEIINPSSVEGSWVDKCHYQISTPSKAVIFGTSIPITIKLVPLVKGIRARAMEVSVQEQQDFFSREHRRHRAVRGIMVEEWKVEGEAETINEQGQEGWLMQKSLPLPTTLKRCLQTVDAMGIRLQHVVRFDLQLINPDEHQSRIRCRLPIHIFLSPRHMPNERNELPGRLTSGPFIASTVPGEDKPPRYGEHTFDEPWEGIEAGGYATPADLSGVSTPAAPTSRSTSAENLSSFGPLTPLNTDALQSRLSHLSVTDVNNRRYNRSSISTDTATTRTPADGGSEVNQAPMHTPERRALWGPRGPEWQITPKTEHFEMDIDKMSQVPSYTDAAHVGIRSCYAGGLPDYESALREDQSASNSKQHSPATGDPSPTSMQDPAIRHSPSDSDSADLMMMG